MNFISQVLPVPLSSQYRSAQTQCCRAHRGRETTVSQHTHTHTPCCTACRGTTASQPPSAPTCTDKCMADKGTRSLLWRKQDYYKFQLLLFFFVFLQISGKKRKHYFERIMTQVNTSTSVTVPFSAELQQLLANRRQMERRCVYSDCI